MEITREQALDLIDSHGWQPNDCTVSHSNPDRPKHQTEHDIWFEDWCESFNSTFGPEGPFYREDVFDWLGY